MEEPELIERLEDAFLEKLRADMGVPGLEIKSVPDAPDAWTAAAAAGCTMVQYQGSRYLQDGPKRPGRPYPQRARFRIWIGAPSHRATAMHVGAYRLLTCAKRAILGSTTRAIAPLEVAVEGPGNEGPLAWTPSSVGFYDEMNQVWWYMLDFESSAFTEEL